MNQCFMRLNGSLPAFMAEISSALRNQLLLHFRAFINIIMISITLQLKKFKQTQQEIINQPVSLSNRCTCLGFQIKYTAAQTSQNTVQAGHTTIQADPTTA